MACSIVAALESRMNVRPSKSVESLVRLKKKKKVQKLQRYKCQKIRQKSSCCNKSAESILVFPFKLQQGGKNQKDQSVLKAKASVSAARTLRHQLTTNVHRNCTANFNQNLQKKDPDILTCMSPPSFKTFANIWFINHCLS